MESLECVWEPNLVEVMVKLADLFGPWTVKVPVERGERFPIYATREVVEQLSEVSLELTAVVAPEFQYEIVTDKDYDVVKFRPLTPEGTLATVPAFAVPTEDGYYCLYLYPGSWTIVDA